MSAIKINKPKVAPKGSRVRISAEIVFPNKTHELWFECAAEYATSLNADTCDAFFVATLIPAMRCGLPIDVEGPLSSKLYYYVENYLIDLLQIVISECKKIKITAKNLVRTEWGGAGVFMGFSAGVDSFCTYTDHQKGKVPDEYAVTHFLYNNVGSHGQTEQDVAIFRSRFERLSEFARQERIPFIAVDSNLDEFIGMDFQLTHTLRNVAVPLLFQRICGKFIYSSTFPYDKVSIHETYDLAYADSICVPMMSTETVETILSGSQYTRFEKTAKIAKDRGAQAMLDVCVAPLAASSGKNCSKCFKCLRTQMTLDILGVLDDFGRVFDFRAFAKMKWLYLCCVLSSEDPFQTEIVKEMKKRNYPVPESARLVAALFPHKFLNAVLDIWGRLAVKSKEGLWRAVRKRLPL